MLLHFYQIRVNLSIVFFIDLLLKIKCVKKSRPRIQRRLSVRGEKLPPGNLKDYFMITELLYMVFLQVMNHRKLEKLF